MGEEAEGIEDPLGEFFMNYITRGQNGQFFTPMHVSEMMAAMTIKKMSRSTTPLATVDECSWLLHPSIGT